MSIRCHNVIAQEVGYMMDTLKGMSNDEIEQEYGITIHENGKVSDPTYPNKKFASVLSWVTESVEDDFAEESFIHTGHHSKYDDD